MARLAERLNRSLDRFIRLKVRFIGREWYTSQIYGFTSLAFGMLLALTLVILRGLSPWFMAGIIGVALLIFFLVAFATKIVTGEEKLVYYHHEIAVLVGVGLFLWLVDRPVLLYLDATILGVGLFLAGGRLGCLMAGCCHGRPSRWGVCYPADYADFGFTPYFIEVRLFPVQLLESLWVFSIVVVGSTLFLSGQPPGQAVAWYIVSYGIGRFFFEFVRGDPERPYYGHFSEPQWISLILMLVVVGAELLGVLTFHAWNVGATVFLIATMLIIVGQRHWRKSPSHRLLHPRHVKEVAELVERVSRRVKLRVTTSNQVDSPPDIQVVRTSLGIQISSGQIRNGPDEIDHYTLSTRNGEMTEEMARILAGLIFQLRPVAGSTEIIKGNQGVYHLLFHQNV